ncbi:MAG: hypothetical protein H0W83_01980 [Planctomycetes bacterium]|nr:hypothetical protein [Planctomycetota bacterium]
MRIPLVVIAAIVLATSSLSAATVDPSKPEAAVLLPASVLRHNDFKSFFAALPAEEQTKAELEWKKAQANPDAKDTKQFDLAMEKLLAPDAVDQFMAQIEPQLKAIDTKGLSENLKMISGLLPMFLQQSQAQAGASAEAQQKNIAMVQSLMSDAADWLLKSGVEDPVKLRTAIGHLVAGAKSLNVADAKALQALPLTDVLDRFGPMVDEIKQAVAVYDLQVDGFLDSITATSNGTGDTRQLDVGFSAFGRSYQIPVKVENKGGKWSVSSDNGAGLGDLTKMVGGPGFAPPADEPEAAPAPTPVH